MNQWKNWLTILLVSTKLGLTSFGGPIAHLGYFRHEYVEKKGWLDEKSYANLVALAQFLPGPASSQVGIGIGIMRGGLIGGILSFIGFTWPSIAILICCALFIQHTSLSTDWLHGLKLVAVAVVAHALIGMAKSLTPDTKRRTIALLSLMIVLLINSVFAQVLAIAVAACLGFVLFRKNDPPISTTSHIAISKTTGVICLATFGALLVLLPIARQLFDSSLLAMFDSFYRAGSLVFGGGHVVLPLLENEFVHTGMMSKDAFLAGYGATQAVPGPLFTFAAYIGTVIGGVTGSLLATVAIFLPAFLLMIGALPFWMNLQQNHTIYAAFTSINAAVVGILFAAFFTPIWTSAILSTVDFVIAAFFFAMLVFWKLPPWTVVVAGIIAGILFTN